MGLFHFAYHLSGYKSSPVLHDLIILTCVGARASCLVSLLPDSSTSYMLLTVCSPEGTPVIVTLPSKILNGSLLSADSPGKF